MTHLLRRTTLGVAVLCSVFTVASCANSNSNQLNQTKNSASAESSSKYSLKYDEVHYAAEDGNADAQYALGYMYFYGKNVPRDKEKAKFWIQKAAAKNHPQAVKALDLLGLKNSKATTIAQTQSRSPTTLSHSQTTRKPVATRTKPITITNSPKKRTIAKNRRINSIKPMAARSTTKQRRTFRQQQKPIIISSTSAKQTKPKKTFTRHSEANAKPKVKLAKHNIVTTTKPKVTKGERRLLARDNTHYTLQILGAHNKAKIDNVIKRNHLDKKASVYHTYLKGEDWYVLIYGDYSTPAEALSAIDRLPPSAQQLKPWVKPIASVKVGIRAAAPKKTTA